MASTSLVMCTDRAYFAATLVLIQSLLSVGTCHPIVVLVEDPSVASESRHLFKHCFGSSDLRVMEIDIHPKLRAVRYFSRAAYGRLYAPMYVNDDRIIYLDSDMLCLQPLDHLDAISIQEHVLAAVTDHYYRVAAEHLRGIPDSDIPQDLWTLPGLNSGLLLIDRKAWLDEDITERAVSWLLENQSRCALADQAALNYLVRGKYRELDARWNFGLYRRTIVDSDLLPSINLLHYTGEKKPWHDPNVPFGTLWWREFCSLSATVKDKYDLPRLGVQYSHGVRTPLD